MLKQKEIEEIKNGSWEIDCPKMVVQNYSEKDKEIHAGSGYIKRTLEGNLFFKLYSERNVDLKKILNGDGLHPGQLIPKGNFYELDAIDTYGRKWKSKNISGINRSGYVNEKGSVVTSEIYEIEHEEKDISNQKRKCSSFNFMIFDEIRGPFNVPTETITTVGGKKRNRKGSLNTAQISFLNCDFEIAQNEGIFNFKAKTEQSKLPRNIEIRALEALKFILARPLDWDIFEKYEGNTKITTIRRREKYNDKWRLGPPIDIRQDRKGAYIWKLFECYLDYIKDFEEADKYHPVTAIILKMIHASGGSIDLESLILAVAVEGILNTEYSQMDIIPAVEKEEIDEALYLIHEHFQSNCLKNRIKTVIGMWKDPSAQKKLSHLVGLGLIDDREYQAWTKLRHPSAHGEQPKVKNFQEYVDLCHIVTVLVYKLIFYIIKYNGKYTDYGNIGWKLKDFTFSFTKSREQAKDFNSAPESNDKH